MAVRRCGYEIAIKGGTGMDSITIKVPVTIKAKLTEKLRKRIIDELTQNRQQADLEMQLSLIHI